MTLKKNIQSYMVPPWAQSIEPYGNMYNDAYQYEPQHDISNNVECASSKDSGQTRAFASRLNIQ